MLKPALAKYNDTVHSSTTMKPKDAHDDKNHINVRANSTRREKDTRKYPEMKFNDNVRMFTQSPATTPTGRNTTQNGAVKHTRSFQLITTRSPTELSNWKDCKIFSSS